MILTFPTTTDQNWNPPKVIIIILVLLLIGIGCIIYGENKPQDKLVLSNKRMSVFTTQMCE